MLDYLLISPLAIYSENEYQSIAGTRSSFEVVEVPSTLFELLIEESEIQNVLEIHRPTNDYTDRFQVLLKQVSVAQFDCEIHRQIERLDALVQKHFKNLHPLPSLMHLNTYGGLYYSYLLSYCIATSILKRIRSGESSFGKVIVREIFSKGGAINAPMIYKKLQIWPS